MSTLRALLLATLIILINGDNILTLNSGSLSNPSVDYCKEDLDYGSNIKYDICSNDKCHVNHQNDHCSDNYSCEIKSLFQSFNAATIATIIAIFVGAFIAAGGGLGGGGIFVPVFILLLDFDAKSAAALSQATIFGGSMANLIMNFRERHTNTHRQNRPSTDFNTILILEPMLLGGTVIGVLLNEILPDPIILICLILVLTIALYRMILKVKSQWKKEHGLPSKNRFVTGDSLMNQYMPDADGNFNNQSDISVNKDIDKIHHGYEILHNSDNLNTDGQTPQTLKQLSSNELIELNKLINKESQVFKPMLVMGCVWIIVSIFALLHSGDFILKVDKCSATYWLFEFGVFSCLFAITFFIAKTNMNNSNKKLQLQWKAAEGDIEWNVEKSIIYPSIAALSGLNVGGILGEILEPMLLGGIVIGISLNEILFDPIILVFLSLVLSIASYGMILEGISQWKKENEFRLKNNLVSGTILISQLFHYIECKYKWTREGQPIAGLSGLLSRLLGVHDDKNVIKSELFLISIFLARKTLTHYTTIEVSDVKCDQFKY